MSRDPGRRARRDAHADAEEAQLVAGLRAGSEAAFALLVHRHQEPMLRVAQRYVASVSTAEDVVQETWLAILVGVDRFDGRSALTTWMYRILSNRAKTTGQRERRCIPTPFEAEDASEAPAAEAREGSGQGGRSISPHHWGRPPRPWEAVVEDRVVASAAVAVVRDAVEGLPANQRLVLTLRGLACWTAEEVCEALDVSPGNQRVLLHRARSRVRQQLAGGPNRAAAQGTL